MQHRLVKSATVVVARFFVALIVITFDQKKDSHYLLSESRTYEFERVRGKKIKTQAPKMSNPDEDNLSPNIHVQTPPVATTPPVEDNQTPKIHVQTPPVATDPPVENSQMPANSGITGILQRWKREDLIKRGSLGLRGVALLFSLISFIAMASNKHGDWRDFDKYEEYRYLLAIAILSSLYTGCQVFRQIHELSTGKQLINPIIAAMVDFFGDQIIAYLLISSASSAIPITNRMREGADNIFTDTSSAAISMSIFAFLCLAVSALISGYKLSTQHYI